MKGDGLVIRYAMKGKTTQDLMHSSGYAKVQPSATASAHDSFASRQSLNQNRQFVQGYGDSKLSLQRNDFQRAKTYNPATDGPSSNYSMGNRQGSNTSSSLRSEGGSGNNRQSGYGRTADRDLGSGSLSASERRARFSSSEHVRSFGGPSGAPTGGAAATPARAPQIPTRRMGI